MQLLSLKNHAAILLLLISFLLLSPLVTAEASSEKVYEMRTYIAAPGKLDDLHARFRDHTTRIFTKHHMKVIGYWVPVDKDNSKTTLIYILEHASADAAKSSWAAFGKDPEWQAVAKASNANGAILADIKNSFMTATDYSPVR
ncbi:MAG: NIPSNAP family protein [Oceanicoccus sp.]